MYFNDTLSATATAVAGTSVTLSVANVTYPVEHTYYVTVTDGTDSLTSDIWCTGTGECTEELVACPFYSSTYTSCTSCGGSGYIYDANNVPSTVSTGNSGTCPQCGTTCTYGVYSCGICGGFNSYTCTNCGDFTYKNGMVVALHAGPLNHYCSTCHGDGYLGYCYNHGSGSASDQPCYTCPVHTDKVIQSAGVPTCIGCSHGYTSPHVLGEAAEEHTITASAGENGTISPAGETTLLPGASKSFIIMPNSNYEVDDVTVNGSSIKSKLVPAYQINYGLYYGTNYMAYTVSNTTGDITIHATFKTQ